MLDKAHEWIVREAAKLLHQPYLSLHYSMLQTLDGKVISDTGQLRAKSWNRNAYNILIGVLGWRGQDGTPFGSGQLCLKNRSGGTSTSWYLQGSDVFIAPAGNANYGILLGSNNVAVTFDGFNIGSLIPTGMGTGQVSYGDTFYTRTWSAPTLTIGIKRYFNNNSNTNISIGEIALCTSSYMFSRERYDPLVSFSDKAQLQVIYSISLTYPAA